MTDTEFDTEQQEMLKTARLRTAELIYQGLSEYTRICGPMTRPKDLEALSTATRRTVPELEALRDAGQPLFPPWDSLTQEQREEIAASEEMNDIAGMFLVTVRRTLNPEAETKTDPLTDLIDHLIGQSAEVTVISGTIRK